MGGKTRRNTAQTTVEFAFICLPFFVLLFAIVDYAQIYFYDNAMQNGLRECCRFSTAGRIIQKTDSSGNGVYVTNSGGVVVPVAITDPYTGSEASRNACSRFWFQSNCAFYLPISNITIVSITVPSGQAPPVETNSAGVSLMNSADTNLVWGPGNANDYIQVYATNVITTITPFFSYLGGYTQSGWYRFPLRVSAIVKNEPALLNFEHTAFYTNEPGYTANPSPLP